METRPQAGSESRTARVAAGTRPRRLRFPAGVVVLASILFLPGQIYAQDRPPARSPERYTTTKTWIPSDPRAINDDGVVVGDSLVFYKGTTVQLLGPFGDGGNSALVAVNNRGQVLLVQIYNGAHYFVYDPIRKGLNPIGLNGKVSEGGTIRTVHLVYLTGLDDEGRVYGIYGTPRGPCAVVGTPTTGNPGDKDPPPGVLATFTLIGCPGGGDLVIRGVNSKGQITGSVKQQGFIWSDGKLSLFSFPGSNSTEGDAINDSGVVAGVFVPGNRVSANGEVNSRFTAGLGQPQMGFTYDGVQFRLLYLPDEPTIYLAGINNRGQIVAHYNARGLVMDSNHLPIAHMEATAAELTAAAVRRREASPPARSDEDPVDRTYKILRETNNLAAASALRAVQALEATGPLGDRKRVRDLDTSGTVQDYGYISVEALRTRLIERMLGSLMSQLGAAQQTEAGREALVDAVAALGGEQGLQELSAVGELAPFGPVRDNPETRAQASARARFKNMIRSIVVASLASHPLEIPPRHVDLWQPSQVSPRQLELLDKTLRKLKEQVGAPAAAIFLAWDQFRGSGISGLFGWQVVEQLVGLNTRGEQVQGEQVLRALAGTPAPAKCPGLGSLKASGGDKDDQSAAILSDTRAELAGTIVGIGNQLFREIYAEPNQTAASIGSASPNAGAAAATPQPSVQQPASKPVSHEVANPISSPVGAVFSGSNATLQDGILTFTLKAPSDQRNGQTLSFKGLIPLPGQSGKAWIAEDKDGYVVFSILVPGVVMGQVLPKAAGEPVYEKAVGAQKKP
jgi:hypothetical protein